MLGLGVKINVDSFQLDAATNKLVRFGQQFEHHFWRHMNRLVGASGLAIGVFKLVERIFGKPREIEETAKKWGMTTDEIQYFTIAAKEAGITFEDFMSRAKKGAIDLQKVFRDMNDRGVSIISKEDIDTVNKDWKYLKQKGEAVLNASIHGTATAIRGVEGSPDALKKGLEEALPSDGKLANTLRLLRSSNQIGWSYYMNPRPGAGKSGPPADDFDLSKLPPLPLSNFASRLSSLNDELAQLRAQRAALKGTTGNELISPQLSGWQQIGGYSSQQGAVVAKLDDVKNAVNEVDDAIKKVEQAINNLGN